MDLVISNDLEEIRRELFEREIRRCKRNIELIFDEYSRIIKSHPGQFLSTVGELKDVVNTLRQLGKTYINADTLLRTKDDWRDDVTEELEDLNSDLKEWIYRRENPEFEMDKSMTILKSRILPAYKTTQRLVDSVEDAQKALICQSGKEETESEK